MTASLLCGIHCLCLPWLVVVMPLSPKNFSANPTFERIFMLLQRGIGQPLRFCGIQSQQELLAYQSCGLGSCDLVLGVYDGTSRLLCA